MKKCKDEFIIKSVYIIPKKKKKCHNCKHATSPFKIAKLTHHHCQHPELYTHEKLDKGISAWDTLRVFNDTCENHEFKIKL